jgi:hypothetical protein
VACVVPHRSTTAHHALETISGFSVMYVDVRTNALVRNSANSFVTASSSPADGMTAYARPIPLPLSVLIIVTGKHVVVLPTRTMIPGNAFILVALSAGASAFAPHNVMTPPRTCRHVLKAKIPKRDAQQLAQAPAFRGKSTSTSLQMYNLPPSGGGGGGPGNDIKAILPGIVTIAGLALFFMSPLGGIFFAVTNTLFALAIITPIIGWVGLQTWQAFNTVSGPCPNCGYPVRTLKDDQGQPSICVSCGSFIRTNADKDGIELCNNPSDMMGGGSLFDQLFGSMAGMSPQQVVDEIDADINGNKPKKSPGQNKARRESTIIDVDVESD